MDSPIDLYQYIYNSLSVYYVLSCIVYYTSNVIIFLLQCIIVYHYFFITITILVELQNHNYVCINRITVMQHATDVCVNWNT